MVGYLRILAASEGLKTLIHISIDLYRSEYYSKSMDISIEFNPAAFKHDVSKP